MLQKLQTRAALATASALVLALAGCGSDDDSQGATDGSDSAMLLATTTSTQDSGLLDALIPGFEDSSGCGVKTVAVGSGAAMKMGERGDADVLLVHSPADERDFMAAGHGRSRKPVMHNDFVVVGPPGDPADISGADDAADALGTIAQEKTAFASRADDSGTNAKELALWKASGAKPTGSWYLETGQGMGDTLTIASQKQAYTLSDRGTFLATSNLDLKIAYEGSSDLRNNYHVIPVKHEGTNTRCAEAFSRWIRSADVQQKIGEFGIEEYGEPLFHPDALK